MQEYHGKSLIFQPYGRYPLDLDIQSGGTAWYLAVVYVQQTTGKTFIDMDGNLNFTVDDIEKALNFYKRLEDNHVIRNVRTRTDEDGNTALYQSPEFIGGNIAGVLEWGSAVGKYESVLEKGVLEAGDFLTDNDGNSSGWFIKPSLMYAVSANTQYPDEAGAFINFLLNNPEIVCNMTFIKIVFFIRGSVILKNALILPQPSTRDAS